MLEGLEWSELRVVRLDDMNPATYNPRFIEDQAFSGLDSSHDIFGILKKIVWNQKSGNIVSGHQRYRILKGRDIESVSVVVVDLEKEDEVELNLTLNNPHVRGKVVREVAALLEETSNDLPGVFESVNLDDMFDNVKCDFDDIMDFEDDGDHGDHGEKKKKGAGKTEENNHITMVICPCCRGRFRMDSNKKWK